MCNRFQHYLSKFLNFRYRWGIKDTIYYLEWITTGYMNNRFCNRYKKHVRAGLSSMVHGPEPVPKYITTITRSFTNIFSNRKEKNLGIFHNQLVSSIFKDKHILKIIKLILVSRPVSLSYARNPRDYETRVYRGRALVRYRRLIDKSLKVVSGPDPIMQITSGLKQ